MRSWDSFYQFGDHARSTRCRRGCRHHCPQPPRPTVELQMPATWQDCIDLGIHPETGEPLTRQEAA